AGERSKRLPQISGMVPSLFDLPSGCYFAPRCSRATDECLKSYPPMQEAGANRRVACFHPLKGGSDDE
ncbi:MAG: ABC transporter ATP-binding protein, partial [Cloacibacillus sp.]